MRGAACVAAEASAALARQFFDAGNITRMQLSMELAALAQARIAVLTADAAERRARGRLGALMGLTSAEDRWQPDDRLALPLAGESDLAALQTLAKSQRLDLAALTLEASLDDEALRGTRRWRWLGALDVSYGRERGPGDPALRGPGISVQVPLFNQGQGAIARGQARQAATQARLRELELAIDNDVALQVDRIANARAVAEHYRTELIPQRDTVVRETQAQVAYMLVGAFELIAAKQAAYDAYQAYLESLRDYWLARVDLQRAVGGQLPGDGAAPAPTEGAEALIHPATDDDMHGMHHSGHDMGSMDMPANDSGKTPPSTEASVTPHGELP
jgi:cobalt-zinc-cadmium efflux system outer membrane protein